MIEGAAIGFLVWATLMLWFILWPNARITFASAAMLGFILIGSGVAIAVLVQ
jgi:cbb3-type cytochrome oxidase subunit 3